MLFSAAGPLVGGLATCSSILLQRFVTKRRAGDSARGRISAVDGDADGSGLDGQIGTLVALEEAGLAGEVAGDVLHRESTGEREPVPLVQAVRLDVVAGGLERLDRELLGLALDLLHAEHVDVLADEPLDDPADSGADGVHVPGRDAHGIVPTGRDRGTSAG